MTEPRGDLHLHSTCSDGSTSPENLIRYAKAQGLSFAAVTDHNTMAGVARAAAMGKALGIQVIPGMELSCRDGQRADQKVHLLSYFLTPTPTLENISRATLESRNRANWEAFRRLKQLYPVEEEMLTPFLTEGGILDKQNIMRLLMDMGYTDRVYSPLFDELFSAKGGSCFVPAEYPEVRQVLRLARESGGVCVVAHSMDFHNFPLVEELTAQGLLDGVEVRHPKHSEEDKALLLSYAREHGLAVTGGTDFHGSHRKHPDPVGACFTTGEELSALKRKKTRGILAKSTCIKPQKAL